MKRRVVVTGIGILSSIGNTVAEFSQNLKAGICGKEKEEHSIVGGYEFPPIFPLKKFDPRAYKTHLLDPFIQYAVAAAEQAVTDARFDLSAADPYSISLSVSSSKGGVHSLDRFKGRLLKNP
ncbi:MAG TPA: beta-ketoacyl synthase N-terminal-like domain-containing protein, partial [Candidatus Omnitrophota bacterium]|nr:beta-ketoacyl synthase N-terminal-like domain-containing protein [Candidatus Omnitrophota bacterium]